MLKRIVVIPFLSVASLFGFVVSANAQSCTTWPHTLSNGTTADASQVMDNFNCAVLVGGSYSGLTLTGVTLAGTTNLPGGTITSSGHVGVGTASPTTDLQIYDSSPTLTITQNPYVAGSSMIAMTAAGGSGYATIQLHSFDVFGDTGGGAHIGDTSHNPWVNFSSSGTTFIGSGGTCTINGSGACTSDARLKTDIKKIDGAEALNRLTRISGVTYHWADPSLDQKQRVGVLAQSVLRAFPQLVDTTTVKFKGKEGTYYTVNYAGLTAPLISAVDELNRRVMALQTSAEFAGRSISKSDIHSAPIKASSADLSQLLARVQTLQDVNANQAREMRRLRVQMGETQAVQIELQTQLRLLQRKMGVQTARN